MTQNILALPGSLRTNSSSNALLSEITTLLPAGVSMSVYDGIGSLPHFNDSDLVPDGVQELKERIRKADAILICTPEYAFGVPGSLKNALDWTVGSGEFAGKPVGLITAATHAEKCHAAMLLILTAISAKVDEEATLMLNFIRSRLDEQGRMKDPETREKVKKVIDALIESI